MVISSLALVVGLVIGLGLRLLRLSLQSIVRDGPPWDGEHGEVLLKTAFLLQELILLLFAFVLKSKHLKAKKPCINGAEKILAVNQAATPYQRHVTSYNFGSSSRV